MLLVLSGGINSQETCQNFDQQLVLGFCSRGLKFRENRLLFIWLFVPYHREQGVLPILSISGLQITTYSEKSKGGGILT
jgi:hypothetical protein